MSNFKIVVIKIGSSTLTDEHGNLDKTNLQRLVDEIAGAHNKGHKVIIVSSGAIVTGAGILHMKGKPSSIQDKQASAAVGQSVLMHEYSTAFKKHNINIAQILLTRSEIEHAGRNSNVKNALDKLLSLGVIPIVNENDTVAVDEIKIGDNDNLSGEVAKLMKANLHLMLTDVKGFIINGQVVPLIKHINKEIESAAGNAQGDKGTGGMKTKLDAAKIASSAVEASAIADGREPGVINTFITTGSIGTTIIIGSSTKL